MNNVTPEFAARRRAVFRELMLRPGTLFPLVGLPLPAAIVFQWQTHSNVAALMAAVGVVVALVIWRFQDATNHAQDTLMTEWGAEHGLEFVGDTQLPQVVPLLRAGDRRRAESALVDRDDSERALIVCHYTYTEGSSQREDQNYPFTVCHRTVSGAGASELPRVLLHRRKLPGLRIGDWLKSATTPERVVQLESVEFNRKFVLMVSDAHDDIAVRSLFTPAFIVWLLEKSPPRFIFEMEANSLVTAIPDHVVNPRLLDELLEATQRLATHIARTTHQELISR